MNIWALQDTRSTANRLNEEATGVLHSHELRENFPNWW